MSVLTRATLEEITGDPAARGVIRQMMVESQAVGEMLGVKFTVDVETSFMIRLRARTAG